MGLRFLLHDEKGTKNLLTRYRFLLCHVSGLVIHETLWSKEVAFDKIVC